MKVLWIHNFNPSVKNSGIFMHSFYKSLLEKPSDIDVSLYYAGNLNNIYNYLSYIRRIKIASKSFDIVHVQYGSLLSFIVAISLLNNRGIVKILSLRGSDWYFMRSTNILKRLHSLLSISFTRISIPFFDAIFPVSERMKSGINKDKSYTLVSPLNTSLFYIDRNSYEKEYYKGKRVSKILFASISIDNEIKNYGLLKNAVELLNKGDNELFYRIVTASEFNNSDMKNVYNSVDLICLTSKYEGWPNVIKEALSCGLPFVSTDVSDLSEVAKKFPNTCFISKPNAIDFSNSILLATSTLISDLTRELLRNEIKSICDIDISRKKIVNIYKQLISIKRGSYFDD